MFTLRILCHGTLKEAYLRDACAEYIKRLGAYCRVEVLEAKDDRALLSYIKNRETTCALCIEGEELSSEDFARSLLKLTDSGAQSLSFVIGGSDGLPETTKAACARRISFSRMTFPHQLMRVILLEQLYRAMNINHNGKYHK